MFLIDFINTKFSISDSDEILLVPNAWDVSYIVCLISNTLCNLYKLHKLGLKDKHVKICIVTGPDVLERFKETDPETNINRLKFIINQFKEKDEFDVSYSIYVSRESLPYQSPEVSTGYWPFKRKWIGNKNQIAVRTYPFNNYDSSTTTFGFRHRGTDLSFYMDYAKTKGYDIVEYNYETSFDRMVDNFIASKFVVSDYSGLTCLANFIKAPTVIVTEEPLKLFGKPITWGIGNLTSTSDLDLIEEDIKQGFFDGPIECVSSKDPYLPEFI